MARTYNESKSVFLAGPIEWWWNTEEAPNQFHSDTAQRYRKHRDALRDFFVQRHYLVYSPHSAFKGDWNEKMQPVNDYVLGLSDIIIDMTPDDIPGIVAKGTEHEVALARELGKIVIHIPPLPRMNFKDRGWIGGERYGDPTFNPEILNMVLETKKLQGLL